MCEVGRNLFVRVERLREMVKGSAVRLLVFALGIHKLLEYTFRYAVYPRYEFLPLVRGFALSLTIGENERQAFLILRLLIFHNIDGRHLLLLAL